MPRARLLLALALLPGLLAACEGALFTLDDVTEKLTITNASASQSAVALVTFGDASSQFRMPPGTSRTATVIGATDYTIEVLAPDLPAGASYESQLIQLRRDLADLVGTPYLAGVSLETFVGEMDKVQAALEQLHGSKTSQSCTHATAPNGHNRATITFSLPGGMSSQGLWQLSCG
jgi:hypothetical protein